MYFIIGVWGGPRKLYAAIKFFLYTLTGSVLMLLGYPDCSTSSTPAVRLLHLRDCGTDEAQPAAGHAAVGVLGVLYRLCHQGPDVPLPHLAA
ncbi:MAG: hypothetical protein QM757_15895 [Paludibaculum sp.]